jgi:hypothetical protein
MLRLQRPTSRAEKAKDCVAVVFRNFLRPVSIVYTAYAAAALLLDLRNWLLALPDQVLHISKI